MSLAWMMVLIFLGVGLLLLAPMAVLYLIVRRFFGEGSDWSRLGRSITATGSTSRSPRRVSTWSGPESSGSRSC